jgi:hypothetical protein
MTPTELEALARRVETEPASDELCAAIDTAIRGTDWIVALTHEPPFGRTNPALPMWLFSIDAAASLLSPEWRCDLGWRKEDDSVQVAAWRPALPKLAPYVTGEASGDYAEARARCAAAIRVLAMRMKDGVE